MTKVVILKPFRDKDAFYTLYSPGEVREFDDGRAAALAQMGLAEAPAQPAAPAAPEPAEEPSPAEEPAPEAAEEAPKEQKPKARKKAAGKNPS